MTSPTPANFHEQAALLCATCRVFGERGWCRATSGNFSVRIGDAHFLIARSGCDKSVLTTDDLLICDVQGNPATGADRPSAETPLHTALYSVHASIGAVLHTHSIYATLLSMTAATELGISDFEMQKALAGVTTHEAQISIPVFENDQDMRKLAARVVAAGAPMRSRVS